MFWECALPLLVRFFGRQYFVLLMFTYCGSVLQGDEVIYLVLISEGVQKQHVHINV